MRESVLGWESVPGGWIVFWVERARNRARRACMAWNSTDSTFIGASDRGGIGTVWDSRDHDGNTLVHVCANTELLGRVLLQLTVAVALSIGMAAVSHGWPAGARDGAGATTILGRVSVWNASSPTATFFFFFRVVCGSVLCVFCLLSREHGGCAEAGLGWQGSSR